MKIKAILAMSPSGAIGDGKLLYRNKQDLSHFKNRTMGDILIMGRKTYQEAGALKGRIIIVVSSTLSSSGNPENVLIARSPLEALEKAEFMWQSVRESRKSKKSCVWVCGGKTIYDVLFHKCSEIVATRFYKEPKRKIDKGNLKKVSIPDNFERNCDVQLEDFAIVSYIKKRKAWL